MPGPTERCRVTLPPRAHWTATPLTEATPLRDKCKWQCVAAYRKVRVADKDRCIPCQESILPNAAAWVTDAGGSSCGWRCRAGFERLNEQRCSACIGGLPASAEWNRAGGVHREQALDRR